jgi:hypothetical protein
MLDWEAPTGGYLLQATLATGAMAGRAASALARSSPKGAAGGLPEHPPSPIVLG